MTLVQPSFDDKRILNLKLATPSLIFATLALFLLYQHFHDFLDRNIFLGETFFARTSYIQFFMKDLVPQLVTPLTFLSGIILGATKSFKVILYLFRTFNILLFIFAAWEVPRKIVGSAWASCAFLVMILAHSNVYFYLSQARYENSIYIFSFLYLGLIAEGRELGKRSALYSSILLFSGLNGVYYFSAFWLFALLKNSCKNLKQYLIRVALIISFMTIVFAISGVLPQFFETMKMQDLFFGTNISEDEVLSHLLWNYFQKSAIFYSLFIFAVIVLINKFRYLIKLHSVAYYSAVLIVFGTVHFFLNQKIFSPITIPADMAMALVVTMVFFSKFNSYRTSSLTILFLFSAFLVQMSANPYFYKFEWIYNRVGFPASQYIDFPEKQMARIAADDKVFDPNGFLYYAKPCSNRWTTDETSSNENISVTILNPVDLKNCKFVVFSREFSFLSLDSLARISRYYINFDYPLMQKRDLSKPYFE